MPTNDFLPFAVGGGANVVSQPTYAGLTSLLAGGFSSGTAESNKLNKVWRQSSIMAAVLAQFIANQSGQDSIDDGTTATLLANLTSGILRGNFAIDSGTVNVYSITLPTSPGSYSNGQRFLFSTANANTSTAPTLNVNGLGAVVITSPGGGALVAGQIPANVIVPVFYNAIGTPRFELSLIAGTLPSNVSVPSAQLTGNIAAARMASAFTGSLASNGYTTLPNGLIVQWGNSTTSASADVTVTFPIAFPTGIYSLAAMTTSNSAATVSRGLATLTNCVFSGWLSGSRSVAGFNWIAIGN